MRRTTNTQQRFTLKGLPDWQKQLIHRIHQVKMGTFKIPKSITTNFDTIPQSPTPQSTRRRKHAGRRTKYPTPTAVPLHKLSPGMHFVTENTDAEGDLLYVNNCRAHVRLTTNKLVKIGDITFPKTQYIDISPNVSVFPKLIITKQQDVE
jgi:hypothetical protein